MKYLLSLIAVAVLLSCERDDNPEQLQVDFSQLNLNPRAVNFGAEIQTQVYGRILDQFGNPLAGAQIVAGSSSTESTAIGTFALDNVDALERLGTMTVSRPGYVTLTKSWVPTEGGAFLEIQLMDASVNATISSGMASVVEEEGLEIDFAGAFVAADGSAYTGNVQVSVQHLAADDPATQREMPGMLYGQEATESGTGLQTYGMLGVQLTDMAGNELQLAANEPASIRMPIAESQLATAPMAVPLWHLDEEAGIWIEEGMAYRNGDFYEGTVSHFSFWNIDYPIDTVTACIDVTSTTGSVPAGTNFRVTSPSLGTSYAPFNAVGSSCGLFVAGETVLVEVYDTCGTLLHTESVGPVTQNGQSLQVSTAIIAQQLTDFSIDVVDCNGAAVSDGYVMIQSGFFVYPFSIINGIVTGSFLACGSQTSFSVSGLSTSSGLYGSSYLNAAAPLNGYLQMCDAGDNYFMVNYNGYLVENSTQLSFTTDGSTFTIGNDGPFSCSAFYMGNEFTTGEKTSGFFESTGTFTLVVDLCYAVVDPDFHANVISVGHQSGDVWLIDLYGTANIFGGGSASPIYGTIRYVMP